MSKVLTRVDRAYLGGHLFWVSFPAILLAYALRDLNAVIWPAAFYEDGRQLIEYYYNQEDWLSAWRFYRGYVTLASNLVAYLSSGLPTAQIPLFYTLCALTFISLPVGLLLRSEIRLPLMGAQERLLLAAIVIVAPIANFHLLNTLTYSQWPLLASLTLIAFFLEVQTLRAFAAYATLSLLCIFSNPVAVVLVPLIAYRAWRERGTLTGRLMLLLLMFFAFYLLVGVRHGASVLGTLSPELFFLALRTLLERVFFEGVFGGNLRMTLLRADLIWVVSAGGLAVFLGCLWLHWKLWHRDREAAFTLLPVWAIAYGMTIPPIYIRSDSLTEPWDQRYSYVPSFIFLTAAFILVTSALRQLKPGGFRLPVLRLVLVAWATVSVQLQTHLYKRPTDDGKVLAQFLEAVAVQEAKSRPFCLVLNRGHRDRWRIKLNSDGWEGSCEEFKAGAPS